MKITVLMDNHTEIDAYYLGEPAVSYWIEAEGKKFLFDTGYSEAFLKNAQAMEIAVEQADALILSHGHNDHTGGLAYLSDLPWEKKPSILAHPDALRPHALGGMDIGSPVGREKLEEWAQLRLTAEPLWLTEKLVFLGEIPRKQEFEPPYAIGTVERNGKREADFIRDDTALAYCGEAGLYLITGCSHSGICNILQYAKEVTGKEKIQGVLGGFHLMEEDERAKGTIAFLEKENIPFLYPCHCTSFAVRAALHQKCSLGEVGVGLRVEWN